jgi:predicted nucleic acid-binding protein
MTIPVDRWLLDTNVWIFGLRRDPSGPGCAELLDRIGSFIVTIPLQVLKELNLNLTEPEMRELYQLLNSYPDFIEVSWQAAPIERVRYFEGRGCRKGDAVITAHAEMLGIKTIISENRQFLQTIEGLPLEVVTSAAALARLRFS